MVRIPNRVGAELRAREQRLHKPRHVRCEQRHPAEPLYRAARLNVLVASDRLATSPVPFTLSEDDARAALTGGGWTVTAVRPSSIAGTMPDRLPETMLGDLHLEASPDGHALLPAWLVTAERAAA